MVDNSYFNTGDKSLCSGCGACQQACPFNALSMQCDDEGFIFPKKDMSKCIECGLCEKICPFPKPDYSNNSKPVVLATYIKDVNQRKLSTSGGIFYLIAKMVIEKGGIVYGAVIDDNMQVFHKGVETLDELQNLRGSKYVQSLTGNCYREAKEHLKNGRLVYYTGCGCQIAGLKSFLRKEYTNLITSDLICHGVPNQATFDKHIKYLQNKYNGHVIKYRFRDNSTWSKKELFEINNGISNKIFKIPELKSAYMYAFAKSMILRYSCYNCSYSRIPRQGDITLADFWGVEKYFPQMKPQYGVSLISINSEKGDTLWNDLKDSTDYVKSEIDIAIKNNHNFNDVTRMPDIRKNIFNIIAQKGYDKVAETVFCPSNIQLCLYYTKQTIKTFLGKNMVNRIKRIKL